jgi:hypothetical protein
VGKRGPLRAHIVTRVAPRSADWQRAKGRHLCITLAGSDARQGRTAGVKGLSSEIFTDEDRRIVAICLDWVGAEDATPTVGLREAFESAAAPGDVHLETFDMPGAATFADGLGHLVVSFTSDGAWSRPVETWDVVDVGAGVLLGIEKTTHAIEWVSVAPVD